MKPFEYRSPSTLNEALTLLSQFGEKGKLIAGGTDLLVDIEQGRLAPDAVINILNINELRYITEDKGEIHLGPLTTFDDMEKSPLIRDRVRLLYQAAYDMGSPQIRNRATIGGNVGKTSVAADGLTALMALDASIRVKSVDGERTLTLDELTRGPGDNCLSAKELITDIFFDAPKACTATAFYKLARRRALGIADIGGAACIATDTDGICTRASVRGGALARYPLRFEAVEAHLTGKPLTPETIDAATPLFIEAVCESLKARPWEIPYKKGAVAGVFKAVFSDILDQLNLPGASI